MARGQPVPMALVVMLPDTSRRRGLGSTPSLVGFLYITIISGASRFRPPSATVDSTEPFSHGTGTMRCLQKEMATDLCPCGETHIVESCPLTKLNCGLRWLHSVDEDAVLWLTN